MDLDYLFKCILIFILELEKIIQRSSTFEEGYLDIDIVFFSYCNKFEKNTNMYYAV